MVDTWKRHRDAWNTGFLANALLVLLFTGCRRRAQQSFQPPSFEAKVYENEKLGFSVHYPADFLERDLPSGSDLEGTVLLMAASPQRIPNIVILRHKMVVGLSLKAFGEQLRAIYAQTPGGGEAKIESARETTKITLETRIDLSFWNLLTSKWVEVSEPAQLARCLQPICHRVTTID